MANNHRRLIEESDMMSLADARGYRTTRKGQYIFIYCPLHEKKYWGSGKPQQNCYFKEGANRCFCTVCNKSFTTKDYLEVGEEISFGEAYDMLWDIMGRPEWYKTAKGERNKAEFEREKRENRANQVLNLRLKNTDKFLLQEERNAIMKTKKSLLLKRMDLLEQKFQKDMFKKEKEAIR